MSRSSTTKNPAATSFARPNKAQVAAATGRTLKDVIGPRLRVLFCGINPGLYSAATGHHFARPGNRFWPALHAAGFTPQLLDPSQDRRVLRAGYGLTNLVERATASADELAREEFVAGSKRLARKVRRYKPGTVAFLGLGAYRQAFGLPKARFGLQPERLEGARMWVLPSPSGLNASYQLPALVEQLRALRRDTVQGRRRCTGSGL